MLLYGLDQGIADTFGPAVAYTFLTFSEPGAAAGISVILTGAFVCLWLVSNRAEPINKVAKDCGIAMIGLSFAVAALTWTGGELHAQWSPFLFLMSLGIIFLVVGTIGWLVSRDDFE